MRSLDDHVMYRRGHDHRGYQSRPRVVAAHFLFIIIIVNVAHGASSVTYLL